MSSSPVPSPNSVATHVWLIANPVGGGGKTPRLVTPLLQLLSKRFVDFKPLTASGKIGLVNTSTGPEGVARRETCRALFTADVGDGIRLAKEAAREIAAMPQDEVSRCFVIPVGGDGTLSEVIHGVSSVIMRELGLGASFMPNIVYLAAGTGADFARLGMCCKDAKEVMRVINATVFIDPTKDTANPLLEEADDAVGCVRRVDVGCVTHVKTNEFRYFTNEASVGLSNAVVVSVVDFKKKRWISCFGGAAVFLSASAYELFKMKAHRFRMRKLPAVASGASSVASEAVNPVATYDHPNVVSMGSATPLSGTSHVVIPKESSLTVKDSHGPKSADEQKKDWDQGDWVYLDSTALVFGNGQFFGGGMKICPHADPCDQALSIASWGETIFGYATGVPSIYNGNATYKWKTSRMFDGSRVLVELAPTASAGGNNGPDVPPPLGGADRDDAPPPPHAFMETDGEPIGALPVIIEISHQVNFLLPVPKRGGKKGRKQK